MAIGALDGSPGTGAGWFLRPNPAAFALCLVLLAWTAARIAALHAARRDRVLAFPVWWAALLVLYCQALSAVGQLHWAGLLILSGLGASAAILAAPRRSAGPVAAAAPAPRVGRGELVLLAALVLPAATYGLWETWLIPSSHETCGDNVAYHLPRLGYWMQRQSVASFVSSDPRSGTFPPDGDIVLLLPVLFLRTDRFSALAQLVAFFGTGGAIAAIARDLGSSRLAAMLAAACWLSIPTALGQASTSWVDVLTAFFTVSAVAFAIRSIRLPGACTWTCVAAAALAAGTKTQTVLLVVPVGALALLAAVRAGRRPSWIELTAGSILAGVLALVSPLQNLMLFGSPHGLAAAAWVGSNPSLSTLAKNLQLVLAPLNPFLEQLTTDYRVEPWSLAGAVTAPGLGLLWVAAALYGLFHFAWRALRGRTDRLEWLYAGGALASLAATLFLMRHQPSVIRFVLPAVAVLTPLIARAVEPWLSRPLGRIVPVGLVSAVAAWSMLSWAAADLRSRTAQGTRTFKPFRDTCDWPYRALAQAFEDQAERDARIGFYSHQGFPQRFFFGERFSNVVLPLARAQELGVADLDRLRLDAVWFDSTFPALHLVRQAFTPPSGRFRGSWRVSSLDSYREEFHQAMTTALEYRSVEPLVLALARRGSGWGVAFSDRYGLLFTRQATTDDALAPLGTSAPLGVEVYDGAVYSRLGDGDKPVVITVFAGRDGFVECDAPFGPKGPKGTWPRRVIVRSAQGPVVTPAPDGTLVLPVVPGLNRFLLHVRTKGLAGAERNPLAIAAPRLRWTDGT